MKENQKAYQFVFEEFYDRIMDGRLELDDRLSTERDVAELLSVSRNSVREAYHILEMMGIIECIQGSGNYVRCQPQEYMIKTISMMMILQGISLREVFEMRRSYELAALDMAIAVATEQEVSSLGQLVEEMERADSVQESAELDLRFHRTLVGASHNRLMDLYNVLIGELLDRFIKDLRASMIEDADSASRLGEAHRAIYQSLVERNVAAGHDAMNRHFAVVYDHLVKLGEVA